MKDYHLKFESMEVLKSVLKSFGFTEEEGNLHHPKACIDWVGDIMTDTNEFIVVDGETVRKQVPIEGVHVNIRTWDSILATQLNALPQNVYPKTPIRVWF